MKKRHLKYIWHNRILKYNFYQFSVSNWLWIIALNISTRVSLFCYSQLKTTTTDRCDADCGVYWLGFQEWGKFNLIFSNLPSISGQTNKKSRHVASFAGRREESGLKQRRRCCCTTKNWRWKKTWFWALSLSGLKVVGGPHEPLGRWRSALGPPTRSSRMTQLLTSGRPRKSRFCQRVCQNWLSSTKLAGK